MPIRENISYYFEDVNEKVGLLEREQNRLVQGEEGTCLVDWTWLIVTLSVCLFDWLIGWLIGDRLMEKIIDWLFAPVGWLLNDWLLIE